MNPGVIRALYVALALGVAFWLYSQWNSSERQIRRQLREFGDTVEKSGSENGLVAANTSRRLGEFLARDFEIHAAPFAGVLKDRARLSQVLFQYRRRAESITVDFQEMDLAVDERLRAGDMTFVAAVSGEMDTGRFRERYRFRLRWIEEEGVWRIQRGELLEILEGTPGIF